jgi:hypothetical protein
MRKLAGWRRRLGPNRFAIVLRVCGHQWPLREVSRRSGINTGRLTLLLLDGLEELARDIGLTKEARGFIVDEIQDKALNETLDRVSQL